MINLSNQNIVVTGAGGFIGSHLVEELIPLCKKVTALLHYDSRSDWGNLEFLSSEKKQAIEVVAGDICDAGFIQRLLKGKDVVFHLAALIAIPYSYHAPASYFQTNAIGTINILEGCREQCVSKLVSISTSECYGTALYTPIDEKHPLQAQSPYSASKISADKAVDSFYNSFDLPAVVIRPFNTFGPRQSARAVIPTIISQVLSDDPHIKLGSLSPIRDFTFVKDTVSGMISGAASENICGETINLGVGKGITIGDVVDEIQTIAGTQKEVIQNENRKRPEKSEVMQLISDRSKAKTLMGWEPRWTLNAGLCESIEFFKSNKNFVKSGKNYSL